jgi:cell division septum initiation protein DivIVA
MSASKSRKPPDSAINSISEPQFAIVRRGFDPHQVSEYVRTMDRIVEVLDERVLELESETDGVHGTLEAGAPSEEPRDPYEEVSARVTDVIRAFDQDVERMRNEAKAEAERIVQEANVEANRSSRDIEKRRSEATAEVEGMLAEARAESDRIRVDAQGKAEDIRGRAERFLEDARAKAEALLSDLESQRRSLLAEIRALHDRMLESAKDLEPVLNDQPADEVVVAEQDVAASEDTDETSKLVSPGK